MSQPTNRRDFLVTASAAVVVATGSLVACAPTVWSSGRMPRCRIRQPPST